MTDPNTFTSEMRSWQWELVLRYEDGSLPAGEWNETTLGTVASWYAKNLPREKATEAIQAVDGVWESLLTRALEGTK